MAFKSIFKPENSMLAGVATVGVVFAIFELDIGSVSQAHATPAHDGNLQASLKKAGYTSLVAVAALGLLARDANMLILGSGAIVAMELHYRHAIMTDRETGQLVMPSASSYAPAENVVPITSQGDNVAVG